MALNATVYSGSSSNKTTASGGPGATTINVADATTPTSITDGTAANQAQKQWTAKITLAATTLDIDLTNLAAVAQGVGDTSFAKVKYLRVAIVGGADGDTLLVGGAGSNAWSAPLDTPTAKEKVQAFGSLTWQNWGPQAAAPWAVDSSHKILHVDSGAATITFTITIYGV